MNEELAKSLAVLFHAKVLSKQEVKGYLDQMIQIYKEAIERSLLINTPRKLNT